MKGMDYDEFILGDSCPQFDYSSDEDDSVIPDEEDRSLYPKPQILDNVDDGDVEFVPETQFPLLSNCGTYSVVHDNGKAVVGGIRSVTNKERSVACVPSKVKMGHSQCESDDSGCSYIPDSQPLHASFGVRTTVANAGNLKRKELLEGVDYVIGEPYEPFVEDMLCILLKGWKDLDPEVKRRRYIW